MLMYVLVPLILVTGLLIFAGRSIVPRVQDRLLEGRIRRGLVVGGKD